MHSRPYNSVHVSAIITSFYERKKKQTKKINNPFFSKTGIVIKYNINNIYWTNYIRIADSRKTYYSLSNMNSSLILSSLTINSFHEVIIVSVSLKGIIINLGNVSDIRAQLSYSPAIPSIVN